MQVLGFTNEERETIFKILASILHLGNIYFHRKQLKMGMEGVEIGSDVEIKWTAHLLQLNIHGISRALVAKVSKLILRNFILKHKYCPYCILYCIFRRQLSPEAIRDSAARRSRPR